MAITLFTKITILPTRAGISAKVLETEMRHLARFHVSFWLSYILVYLFYLCPNFCSSYNK